MILHIPPELQIQIFSYLPFSDQINIASVCTLWYNLLKTRSILRTRYLDRSPGSIPENMHRLLSYDGNTGRFGCILQSGRVQEYFIENTISQKYRDDYRKVTESPFLDEPLFSPFARENKELRTYMANFEVRVSFRAGNIALRRIGPGVEKFCADGCDMTIRRMVDVLVQSSRGDIGLLIQEREDVKIRIGFIFTRQGFCAVFSEIIPKSTT
ncbi:hypothetical protein TWF694_011913 [Orbilia ellipsospora]|uniref:F-box domain-containing protein n=1 Tax=Orbilia ellipsospora TaxID=2528407 RepID=A0AAV9X4J6_9PEZI